MSQLSYDTVEDLRSGIASEDGRSTIADLANFATGGVTLLIVENLRRLTAGLQPQNGLRDGVTSEQGLVPVTWADLALDA